jgi:extracellular factor (EF) 3-hydroxypalmitic acid methyl ester biosynthesis protein
MFNFHDNLSDVKGRPINTFTYHANLKSEEGNIEGDVSFASVSSLFFKHTNGNQPENGQNFGSVEIELNNNKIQLEQCQFLKKPSTSNVDGQIIFTENVYNFYELFSGEKLININSYFSGLPTILLQKEKIEPAFKDFTANLLYDLNAYKSFFDKIDSDYSNEDPEMYKKIEEIVIEKEGKKFYSFFDQKLEQLKEITSNFSPSQHQLYGNYFRRQLWSIITLSAILYRSNMKPRGYQGDSGTLNMIYDNQYTGDSIFSRLMHIYPLATAAAVAVRNRKVFISDQIKKLYNERNSSEGPDRERLNVLSMACGPVREVEEIITSPEDVERYTFTFLDQDNKALLDAKQTIDRLEQRLKRYVKYVFFPESVRSILKIPDPEKVIGKFDFIYTMGLYDYLTDRIAKKLTEHLYRMLKPGGRLTIGNYHVGNASRVIMEYWYDWVLCYRTEEEFLSLMDGLENSSVSLEFEPTRSQMFAIIKREK